MTFRLDGVRFRYPGSGRDVLAGVDLTVPAGEVVAVLGLSGSGKTTLLNLLGQLHEGGPSGGVVSYDGHDYSRLTAPMRSSLRRRFGFVLQSSYLLPHLSCLRNVEIPLALAGRSGRREAVLALMRQAGGEALASRADAKAREVSGGERQRMAVLRAVAHDPDVVFADEPLSSLDPANRKAVLSLLRSWHAGGLAPAPGERRRTLVLVTHDYGSAFSFADRFVCLRGGSAVVLTRGRLSGPNDLWRLIDPEG